MNLATERLDMMTPPAATVSRYAISPGVSRLTVRAAATGFLSVFGHNPVVAVRSFAGEALVADGTLQGAAVSVTIKADSLSIQNDVNEKDRREMQRAMNEEVLEVNKFPEIRYDCSRITGDISTEGQFSVVVAEGELTLHGVTRNEPISARVIVTADLLRASGEFTVRMSDYQIAPVSAIGGGLKLKDELKITFDVVARKLSESNAG